MEFKTFSIRFGEYRKHPNDVDARAVLLPEDTLFFSRGDKDIGRGKYIGALHYLCLTKATDEELLGNMQHYNPSIIYSRHSDGGILRFNGYAMITIHDCIIDTPIETIDEDKLNELLKPEEQYFVYLSQSYEIISISKLNRILSETRVVCCDVYLHGAIDSERDVNTIMCNVEYKLDNIINPSHRIIVKKVEKKYGQSLLTDAIYKNLALVYPYFSEKRIGYDFDWLKNKSKEAFGYIGKLVDENADKLDKLQEKLGTAISMGYVPKEDVDYEEYKQILNFTKPLPLEEK